MILIADSGSTKTDWILLDLKSGHQTNFEGLGLNPYYSDSNSVFTEVSTLFTSIDNTIVSHIYFYGAGCSTASNKLIISSGIKRFFTKSLIEVYHDLEGASRSLCMNSEGIACILGTGSNAAHYNGAYIVKEAVSLGYLLGDEGSGNHLGKKLIHSIYLKTAPEDIIQDFNNTFNLSTEGLLKEIYGKPYPNRFLASFAPFINKKKNHPFIKKIIQSTFEEFIQLVVLPLNKKKDIRIHFTGSIAWYFKNELTDVVNKLGFILGEISQKPISSLARYHLEMASKQ